jgi:ribosomal protein S6--L-glutamate ligase
MMFDNHFFVGWKEWAKLPELNIPLIKVKIDTGAKTSALHAYDLEIVKKNNKDYASFSIHPIQKNDTISVKCLSEVIDLRIIKSSNGLTEKRYVICTPMQIGQKIWDIEITLTNRDIMHHRMLVGREAMKSILVHPAITFCQGKITSKKSVTIYDSVTRKLK